MTPLVTINPGYSVPPVTRPRGCHVPNEGSNQHTPSSGHVYSPFTLNLHHILAQDPERGGLTVIEPIPEIVESVLNEIFGRSEVEPGIDWRTVSFHFLENWRAEYEGLTFVYDAFES